MFRSILGYSTLPVLMAGILFSAPALAKTYKLDPDHTSISMRWDHFGFSQPSATIGIEQGTLEYNPDHPEDSELEVVMALDTLDSGIPALNRKLRGEDYFHVSKYPQAIYKSSSVEKIDDKKLKVKGQLALHGHKKPVILLVSLNKAGRHPLWADASALGFDATAKLKRSSFDLDKHTPNVGDTIKINITTEVIESRAFERQ